MKLRSLFISLFIISLASPALGDFYFRPRAGAIIPVNDGDVSYTLGASLGYQWTSLLATEVNYSRILGSSGNPDGDLIRGEAILSFPLVLITPYASAGIGLSHYSLGPINDWDLMYLLGGGATFDLLPLISLGVGVNYAFVHNQPDFFEPVIIASLKF